VEATTTGRRLDTRAVAGLIGAALVYSWFAGGYRPFTLPMEIAVSIPIVVALVLALWRRAPRTVDAGPTRTWRIGYAIWAGLFALAAAWELIAYFSLPRYDHPTLSIITDSIMSTHRGRALIFALWLALGWLFFAPAPATQR
jgi:hypothetical protein